MCECSAYMCQCAVYMLGACEGHQRAPEPLELCVDGCDLPRDSGTEPGSSVRAALKLSSLVGCLSGSWVVLSIYSFIHLFIYRSIYPPSILLGMGITLVQVIGTTVYSWLMPSSQAS